MNIEKVTILGADGEYVTAGHFATEYNSSLWMGNLDVVIGKTYTLHGYIKSTKAGTLTCEGASASVTTKWQEVSMSIIPTRKSFELFFYPGEFWIYNWKLEVGSIMSKWTPSPLDAKYDLLDLGASLDIVLDKIETKVWQTDIDAASGAMEQKYSTLSQEVGKIQTQVSTINNDYVSKTTYKQLDNKFSWLVQSGTSSTDFTLTDRTATLVANAINLKGLVTFNGLNSDARKKINDIDTKVGNAQSTANSASTAAANALTDAKNYTNSSINNLEMGGVNLFVKNRVTKNYYLDVNGNAMSIGGWGYSDYIDVSGIKNYIASGFTNLGIAPSTCFYDANKKFISGVKSEIQSSQNSKRKTLAIPSNAKYMRFSLSLVDIDTLKIEQGTKATAYSPAPEDVSKDATDKSNQALSDAKKYSESAVNWVNSNGTNTNNLRNMILKWTNNAVSTNTYIQGGWIATNTITADKIAVDDLSAFSATIGGWTITKTDIYNNNASQSAGIGKSGTSYAFWAGSTYANRNTAPTRIGHDGSLYASNANITGKVTATSLTLGTGVTVSSSKVSGLSAVATSGKYTDLSGKPTIPSKLTDFTGGDKIVYTDNVTVTKTTTNGVIKTVATVGNSSWTTYTADSSNYLLAGYSKGTNSTDGSKSYFKVSTDGLLTAKNALIYGTIYATNGVFTGTVSGSTIKGGTINIGDGVFTVDNKGNATASSITISNTGVDEKECSRTFSVKNGYVQLFGELQGTLGSSWTYAIPLIIKNNVNERVDISAESIDQVTYLAHNSMSPLGIESTSRTSKNTSSSMTPTGFFTFGNMTCSGTKSRLTTTEDYDKRLLYCYEMPSPMFGDIGDGEIDDSGKCMIFIDDIFSETVDIGCHYQVFLQPYGEGNVYISERTPSYFTVCGTNNLKFGWELKAVQLGYDTLRLGEFSEESEETVDTSGETYRYLESLLYNVESEEA